VLKLTLCPLDGARHRHFQEWRCPGRG
jgi:hypothetical protein